MASIFSKIIAGEIPCYKVAETESAIAFLDVRPLKRGHTLIVPKKEVDKLFDLPKSDYDGVMDLAYRVGAAVGDAIPCVRVGVAVLGLEVPHAHVHLIPIDTEKDLNFSNERLSFEEEEWVSTAQAIKAALK
ncbi:HIT family protein [Phaeocystidibacter marisrubri]|uniref:HIT domain-containing protein n=1 Tax=Phaeocystidibacter marisrubri TaxID=1577780 RepID=A0A6L3ZF86_9FLAO|nr:HIT domain-containing protein [Phaeocystidibacter marisrubri]KAB2816072.1 HIT domain-containing protein [Phaeocystidibacter marisrubri]GGH67194.1 HIT family protein [Phaeocystidibacter marisrubri]